MVSINKILVRYGLDEVFYNWFYKVSIGVILLQLLCMHQSMHLKVALLKKLNQYWTNWLSIFVFLSAYKPLAWPRWEVSNVDILSTILCHIRQCYALEVILIAWSTQRKQLERPGEGLVSMVSYSSSFRSITLEDEVCQIKDRSTRDLCREVEGERRPSHLIVRAQNLLAQEEAERRFSSGRLQNSPSSIALFLALELKIYGIVALGREDLWDTESQFLESVRIGL